MYCARSARLAAKAFKARGSPASFAPCFSNIHPRLLPMPEAATLERLERDRREGKSVSTQAGEFVRETMKHIREGRHGACSAKQAIAIGLSKARRAGVKLPPPKKGATSEATRRKAAQDLRKSGKQRPASRKRSRATIAALKREGHEAASPTALARQTRAAARKRTAADRSASARKAARTKGPAERSAAARKAARTRARRSVR